MVTVAIVVHKGLTPVVYRMLTYLNDVISQMPYYKKTTHEELLNLLPHKWKLKHPESVLTKQKGESGN